MNKSDRGTRIGPRWLDRRRDQLLDLRESFIFGWHVSQFSSRFELIRTRRAPTHDIDVGLQKEEKKLDDTTKANGEKKSEDAEKKTELEEKKPADDAKPEATPEKKAE